MADTTLSGLPGRARAAAPGRRGAPEPRPVKGPRLIELDALRFIAAFAVMAFHYLAASRSLWGEHPTELFPSVARLSVLGILGVELFFLISGFVILMSVWGRTVGEFAVSRAARLYPAYWFTVVLIFILYRFSGVTGFDPKLSAGEYLLNLTMLQSAFGVGHAAGVFWSLWVELRFYLLVGIFSLFGITLRRCLVFMSAWLALALVAELTRHEALLLVFMPRQAPYFIAGMACYLIHRFGPRAAAGMPWLILAASFGMSLYAALERVGGRVKLIGFRHFPAPPEAVVVVITLIFALMIAVALGGLRWVRWRGLVTVGALTYPLYLLHQTVSAVLIPSYRDDLAPWPLALLTMAVAIVLSYLVYRFVDAPGQRWLRGRLTALVRRPRRARRGGAPHLTQSGEASVP
ncbi:acyltransferase [Thermobispora bispora]|uniref:Acyltransferase 3 n=1 Tax=Thermobispora bispora (strain ATCC 19993 / DSM 43833 / CBS 139.67 / JCM 10125 / KCTC 9307 / NBRC 14880 / R51) TaxID=469371 RepID=D6YBI9_THEBD|nr:acyltransferase [Thermobispora bispora]MBO2475042.1 acyltransferase [Actinomycetales bacterium]MDI9579075.1 acyltransferase [Thermobispora sp.]ADG88549.1 acyltransferase 3 [Thermobispora bispora DSM 43833]MBX6169003.1 acyltransferase [Thermobispora bispora]QSI48345.1 acyltransferase [Thermobispora bispora]